MTEKMCFSQFVEINPRLRFERGSEYPFVEMGVIEPGRRYVHAQQQRCSKSGGAKFLAGDTVFARITPCLENGKIAQFKAVDGTRAFGSTEFFVFRARPAVSIPEYVYYLAKSNVIRKPAEKSMSGASGRQRADIKSITDLEVPAPDITTQRKIASILSNYDDLIENNLQRIKILEEMAQPLYREWFVKFRFPGHNKSRFIDSHLGKIPEGWEIKTINSLASYVKRGVTPKYESGSGRFIINQKVNRGPILAIENLKEIRADLYVSDDKFERFGDVLVNCLGEGTIGRVHFFSELHQKWAVDQHMSICRFERFINSLYVYHVLSSSEGQSRITALKTGGTNMTMFNISALRSFTIVKPPDSILSRFAEIVRPMIQFNQLLLEANRNLRKTRDLLLPKLISGELNVSEIDITIPEEAA